MRWCCMEALYLSRFFFFFNDTATTEIYTLSLHDALPISSCSPTSGSSASRTPASLRCSRSEEHTSELQSHHDLVCRLLLEKKKKQNHKRRTKNKTHKNKYKKNTHPHK